MTHPTQLKPLRASVPLRDQTANGADLSDADIPVEDLSDAQLLSLVVDGELPLQAHAAWERVAAMPVGAHLDWLAHQQLSGHLRARSGTGRGRQSRDSWMGGLRERLRAEAQPLGLTACDATDSNRSHAVDALPTVAVPARPANDSFWKMVAGVSAFSCVGALAFAFTVGLSGQGNTMVASSSGGSSSTQPLQSVFQPVAVGDAVMIRDAKMMERMAQHRQFGGTGVNASSGFVRHAAFESNR